MPPWRLESTNILGSFPDCSFSAQVLQVPRTRAVPASGQSLVASLTVPFPPRPTSPAYSPTSPACALRCRKPLFFAVCTCRRFESHVLFHTDSPTCVFPCPRALYDAMSSPEASWRTAEPRQRPRLALGARRNGPRGLSSARPDAHRSVFFPYRSPACGVQCNRSSPRFERGAPNFARALTFLPRNTCRFADFASSGLQRPQTTFPSC